MVNTTTKMQLELKERVAKYSSDAIHTVLLRAKRTGLRTSTARAEDFVVIDPTYGVEDDEGTKQGSTLEARCVQTRIAHPPLGIYGLKLYEFDMVAYLRALRAFYDDCPHTHADIVVNIAGQKLVFLVAL